jgi:integrase
VVEKLTEDNVRQGFLRIPEFNSLLAEIPDTNIRDLVEFLYNSGWRSSEPKAMQWDWLDLDSWTVRLPRIFPRIKNRGPCRLKVH